LASKPASICGARRRAEAIKNSGISNIKITILKFKIYRVKQVLRELPFKNNFKLHLLL
jgi:hypothetical protein